MIVSRKVITVIFILFIATLACNGNTEVVLKSADVSESNDGVALEEVVEKVPPVGTARSNPVPYGSEILAFDMVFTVIAYERPADRIVERANRFNAMQSGYREYILIEMSISCQKSFDDKCIIRGSNFELVGDGGIIYNRKYLSGIKGGLITNEEFFGGTTITGKIPFIIERSEINLVLIYNPFLKSPIYFQVQ